MGEAPAGRNNRPRVGANTATVENFGTSCPRHGPVESSSSPETRIGLWHEVTSSGSDGAATEGAKWF